MKKIKFTLNHIKESYMMAQEKGIDYLVKMFDTRRYEEIEGEDPRLDLLKDKLWEVYKARQEAELVYGALLKDAEAAPLKIGRAKDVQ
jgi:hypothetical protein